MLQQQRDINKVQRQIPSPLDGRRRRRRRPIPVCTINTSARSSISETWRHHWKDLVTVKKIPPPQKEYTVVKTKRIHLQTRTIYQVQMLDSGFRSSRILSMDSPNLFAWGPGFTTFTSPHCEHGSINQLLRPPHQAPGVARFRPRWRIFRSIMSRTGPSFLNCRAKADPLLTISS